MKCVLVGYEGDHIYRMLTPNKKVLTFSNVKWIDNISPISAGSDFQFDETPTSSTSKRQCVSDVGVHDLKPNLFAPTPIPTPISTPNSSTSTPLTSAPTTPIAVSSMAPPLRPVTRQLAKKIRSENPGLQEAPLDSMSLLVLLSAANSPEPIEPKSYKEAVSERNSYHKDWNRAMQEEIDSVNENETWILTSLPIVTAPLDGN